VRVLVFIAFLFFTLVLAGITQIPVLGIWESFTFFHNFSPVDAHLSFRISARANIAGQGYALLDISRMISDWFGWSIMTFRLPSLVIGWIGLGFFFTIAARIVGFLPALLASILLATNEAFVVFQSQLIVSMVTFTLCLILVERIQALEANSRINQNVILLGIFTAITGTYYSMGRFFALFLVSFFILKFIYLGFKNLPRTFAIKESKTLISTLLLSVIISFFILSPLNVIDFLSFPSFFFPTNSEVHFVSAGLLDTIFTNIILLLKSLTYLDGLRQSADSTESLANVNITLIFPLFLPFVILGMIKSLANNYKVYYGTYAPYGLINFLFIITLVPPLFSAIHNGIPTFSTFRTFNILIPAYLYGAIGINELMNKYSKYNGVVLASILLLFFGQIYLLVSDRLRFSNAVSEFVFELPLTNTNTNTLFQTSEITKARARNRKFIADQVIYKKYAEKFVKNISDKETTLFTIDLGELSKNSLYPHGLHYLKNKNYHSTFLAFYASDLGLNLAYVQAIDENSSQPIYGSGYRGKKRIFPAEFELRGIRPVYKNPENLEFQLRSTGRGKIKAYLSTTKEELNWTLKYLENKGEAFSVVKISYQNGPDR